MNVLHLMSTAVQTCRTTDTLNKAAALMWHHAIGMVPVLNEQGRLVAVITDRDVAMAAFLTGQRLSEIPVSQSMSRTLHVCRTTDSLQVAQATLASAHVRRLPVLDEEGALRGILSTDDLVRAAASGWRFFALPELVRALGATAYAPPSPEDVPPTSPADAEASAPVEGLWEAWQGGLTQLQQRRDELRLTLHLAGMDAREEWAHLEGRLQDLQDRARHAEKRAESELQRALQELSEGYHRLRARLSPSATTEPPAAEE